MDEKKTTLIYRIIRALVRFFYPKTRLAGKPLPQDEPVVVVGNHSQMHGPIAGELYFPGKHYIWCAGQMMHWKEVHGYAFEDFWSFKPKSVRWLYRILSYLITPLSVCLFNNAHTIPVYHDARLIGTFRGSIQKLEEGNSIIIFPEHNVKANNILYEFQDKFVDLARFYFKKTGKALAFVPMYLCPAFKTMFLGEPVRFQPEAPIREERQRICRYLHEEICRMAVELPEHTVIPYRNIPKRLYPKNIPLEVYLHEKDAG